MHKLMDIYNAQYKEKEKPLLVEMPQITSLLKHLDLLYSIVLKKQIENELQQDTVQYYNSGQGSKSQSDSVN